MVSQTNNPRVAGSAPRLDAAAAPAKPWCLAIPLVCLVGLAMDLSGGPQSGERRLWDVELEAAKKAQQKKDAQNSASGGTNETRPTYRGEDAKVGPLRQSDAILGVTLWRLRPSLPADQVTLPVVDGGREEHWTPVRVSPHETLGAESKVRLTVEVPRAGHLYVINREIYEDGSRGEPYLIFPTLRTLGGDNAVIPGRIVDIPDQHDTPPYFTLRRNSASHAGEVLTVILANEAIPEVAIARNYAKLPEEMVKGWESQWTRSVETFHWDDSEGKQWTVAEQRAASGARLLVQDEPFPQTLYRIQARPGEPLLVSIPLKIGATRQSP